jgi:hypothetical protein
VDEARLIERLRRIEALFAGATTEGERIAAERARERIIERLALWELEDPPVEFQFSMPDMWTRKVFVALLRRYGIRPYRYKRQRYTTVMAKVSRRFVNETLWPEFQDFSQNLEAYLADVTDHVVQQVIHQDSSEAEIIERPAQLPLDLGQAKSGADHRSPSTSPGEQERQQPSGHSHTRSSSRGRSKRKRKKKKGRRGR